MVREYLVDGGGGLRLILVLLPWRCSFMFVWIIVTLLQHQAILIEKNIKKLGILAEIFIMDKSEIPLDGYGSYPRSFDIVCISRGHFIIENTLYFLPVKSCP